MKINEQQYMVETRTIKSDKMNISVEYNSIGNELKDPFKKRTVKDFGGLKIVVTLKRHF
jgi:hypothetical protein